MYIISSISNNKFECQTSLGVLNILFSGGNEFVHIHNIIYFIDLWLKVISQLLPGEIFRGQVNLVVIYLRRLWLAWLQKQNAR